MRESSLKELKTVRDWKTIFDWNDLRFLKIKNHFI
jgi:hypothetical protein